MATDLFNKHSTGQQRVLHMAQAWASILCLLWAACNIRIYEAQTTGRPCRQQHVLRWSCNADLLR